MADITTNTSNEIGTRLLAVNKISNTSVDTSGLLSYQNQSLLAIGAALNKSTISTEKNNEGIVKALSSLSKGKVNKYTPITVELRRIGEAIGFIRATQMPAMLSMMAKDNKQGMAMYDLERKARKKEDRMRKATVRMRKESVLEVEKEDDDNITDSNSKPKKKKGVFSKLLGYLSLAFGGIFTAFAPIIGGGFIGMIKALGINILKIFGRAGIFGIIFFAIKSMLKRFQSEEAGIRMKALGIKFNKLMISLKPILSAAADILDIIGEHLGTFLVDSLMTLADGIMDVIGGFGKILKGDFKGGLKQLLLGKDGKGGLINMLGNLVIGAFKMLGGVLADIIEHFEIQDYFPTWLKNLLNIPDKKMDMKNSTQNLKETNFDESEASKGIERIIMEKNERGAHVRKINPEWVKAEKEFYDNKKQQNTVIEKSNKASESQLRNQKKALTKSQFESKALDQKNTVTDLSKVVNNVNNSKETNTYLMPLTTSLSYNEKDKLWPMFNAL
jgi:hypothetical protein